MKEREDPQNPTKPSEIESSILFTEHQSSIGLQFEKFNQSQLGKKKQGKSIEKPKPQLQRSNSQALLQNQPKVTQRVRKNKKIKKPKKSSETNTLLKQTSPIDQQTLLQIIIKIYSDEYKKTLAQKKSKMEQSSDYLIYELFQRMSQTGLVGINMIVQLPFYSNKEFIQRCINQQPQFTRFMIRVIIKYEQDPQNIKDLLKDEKDLEVAVYKEKLIYRWIQFVKRDNLSPQRQKKILLSFDKLASVTKSDVRSQCTRNIASFFINIIVQIISQLSLENQQQTGPQKLIALRNKFPSIDNIYKTNKNQSQPNLQLFKYNQKIFIPHYSLGLLRNILKEPNITDQILSIFQQEDRIFQKIDNSERIQDKPYLQKYYYCFAPRLKAMRKQTEDSRFFWKFNSYGKMTPQEEKGMKQQCSFYAAQKLQKRLKKKSENKSQNYHCSDSDFKCFRSECG